jgi:hypothetical protein
VTEANPVVTTGFGGWSGEPVGLAAQWAAPRLVTDGAGHHQTLALAPWLARAPYAPHGALEFGVLQWNGARSRADPVMDQGMYRNPPVKFGQELRAGKALPFQVQDMLSHTGACQLIHRYVQWTLYYYAFFFWESGHAGC